MSHLHGVGRAPELDRCAAAILARAGPPMLYGIIPSVRLIDTVPQSIGARMDTFTISVLRADNAIEQATISYDEASEQCQLHLTYRGTTITETADDYFEALCLIRKRLEVQHLYIFCYGASKNVYPSGMARDMGQGLKAYKLTLGKHAATADLVDIFDSGADIEPATVAEQRSYFEAWLRKPKM
jgi:hypothetical protein